MKSKEEKGMNPSSNASNSAYCVRFMNVVNPWHGDCVDPIFANSVHTKENPLVYPNPNRESNWQSRLEGFEARRKVHST